MKCLRSFLFLFVLCFVAPCFCQDAAQQKMALTEMSLVINSKLIDLKKNSAIVTEQLKQLSENLESSQAEATAWKEQSMNLSSSLENINDELNSCYTTITKYEQKLKIRMNIITVLLIILIIRTVCMIIGYIIYFKGIKLPRWLDILL